jgi:hypothetical protein
MNIKTKEMHYGDGINSSFCFGLWEVRSWFRLHSNRILLYPELN